MTDKSFRIAVLLMILLLCAALVVQALVGRSRRGAICRGQNATLTVLHDVIQLASTPPKGKTLTADQVRQITAFEVTAFARIAAARC